MKEAIEQEIVFLREQIKTLERLQAALHKQVLHFETRIDDLRKIAQA